jgi:hypothetical protein
MPLTQVQPGMLGTPQPYNFKNRIINGAMTFDQRNNGASMALNGGLGQYGIDRFAYNSSQASKLTAQQSTIAPVGFYNSNVVTVSSAATIGSGDYFTMFQYVEANNMFDFGWGTANAKTVTLSFWVRSSVTGTFVVGFLNSTFNRTYLATYTISTANTWEKKSVTVPGDTTGSWTTSGTGIGVTVRFDLGSGSSGMGTANAWNAGNYWSVSGAASATFPTNAGATLYITGLQLEVGVTATDFDYRPYTTELALCQRYCQVFKGSDGVSNSYVRMGYGYFSGTGTALCYITNKVNMRTQASVTVSGTFTLYNGTFYTISNGNITIDGATTTWMTGLSLTGSGYPGGGLVCDFITNNNPASILTLSAEL